MNNMASLLNPHTAHGYVPTNISRKYHKKCPHFTYFLRKGHPENRSQTMENFWIQTFGHPPKSRVKSPSMYTYIRRIGAVHKVRHARGGGGSRRCDNL